MCKRVPCYVQTRYRGLEASFQRELAARGLQLQVGWREGVGRVLS